MIIPLLLFLLLMLLLLLLLLLMLLFWSINYNVSANVFFVSFLFVIDLFDDVATGVVNVVVAFVLKALQLFIFGSKVFI